MMRFWTVCIATFIAALAVAAPASAQGMRQVQCDSRNYQPAQCPVDPGARDLQLVRRAGGDCVPNRDWGLRGGSVYVLNGCRAVFAYRSGFGGGYPGGGYPGGQFGGQAVRCESWNYRPATCPINTAGGVGLRNVVAGNCVQGQTWGWDRRSVWVNGGCRADFIALNNVSGGGYPGGGYPGGGGGYPGAGDLVECSSWNYRPARCAARINRGVRIASVIAGECVEGQSWGWDRGGIWVNNGCRARFLAD